MVKELVLQHKKFSPDIIVVVVMQGVNSRNPRRPPPSSVNTGGITEIMAEGGELEFVKRIIHDSLQLKKRLR